MTMIWQASHLQYEADTAAERDSKRSELEAAE